MCRWNSSLSHKATDSTVILINEIHTRNHRVVRVAPFIWLIIIVGVLLFVLAMVWWDDHRYEYVRPRAEVEKDSSGEGIGIVEAGIEIGYWALLGV